jgi:hypothetical protein
MPSEPSPLSRLLRLEQTVEQLVKASLPDSIQVAVKSPPPAPAIWPADPLLLIRLLRRSPQVLAAYQSPAQLSVTKHGAVHLSADKTGSLFLFCELLDGDAVVWLDHSSPDWAWQSETFRSIFQSPTHFPAARLVIEELPLFRPIERGERWVLQRRGAMVLQARPFPEQDDQATLLRRLDSLERQVVQQNTRHESLINELRSQLNSQQVLIDQLLRILPRP